MIATGGVMAYTRGYQGRMGKHFEKHKSRSLDTNLKFLFVTNFKINRANLVWKLQTRAVQIYCQTIIIIVNMLDIFKCGDTFGPLNNITFYQLTLLNIHIGIIA